MIKNGKKMVGLIIVLICAMMLPATLFAGSSINTPTKKYIDNAAVDTTDAVSINNIILTESSTSSWQDTYGGRFTLKIPAGLNLVPSIMANQPGAGPYSVPGVITNSTSPGSLSTSVIGTSGAPHGIFIERGTGANAGNNYGVLFIYNSAGGTEGGSHYGLLQVYCSSSGVNDTANAYQYGSSGAYGTQKARVAGFGSFGTYSSSSLANGSAKVGQIYYDSSTKEIVLTLAARGRDSSAFLEKIILEGFKVNAKDTTGTGDQTITLTNGSADGLTNFLGITDSTAVVASLTDQALLIEGQYASTAAYVAPTIPAGPATIDGQAMGRLKITVIGTTTEGDNKLTISLDNGAKFHTGAATALGSALTIATTSWTLWDAAHTPASLSVSSGQLVILLGSDVSNEQVIQIARSASNSVIDTSGVTADSDITASVAADGTAWAGISGTAVVASAKMVGTTVSFKESSGATELSTLYAGRKGEYTADKLKIAETAPTSLTAGGLLTFSVNLGAKFSTNSALVAVEEDVATYSNSILVLPNLDWTAAAASKSATVATASTDYPGIWYYGSTVAANDFDFDLSAATPGALQITVSGTAGASGVVTIATVINATATTVASSTGTIIPGSVFDVPDIVITEQKAGALVASTIGLKFPAGYSIDATGVTVSAVAGTTSTSNIAWGDVGATETSYAYLSVGAQSTTTLGAYTITISGLKLTAASTVTAGDASLIVAGGTTTWSDTASAGFSSNIFAKPTKATLVFGTVVSATVPTVNTAVLSGTVVSQTFLPAGNDIGKVGDVYLFVAGQYHDGSAWTATETPYASGVTLGSLPLSYDIVGLPGASKVYIGYGLGLTGTYANMNTNATFVLAYTTAATVPVAVGAGAGANVTATVNVTDTYDVSLTTTNAAGATPTQEWIAYQVIVSGTASGWWFLTPTGTVQQYTAGMDLSTVLYDTAAAGSVAIGQYKLGTYLPTAGDQLIIAYVYSTSTIDIADPTSYVVENVVTMTVQ